MEGEMEWLLRCLLYLGGCCHTLHNIHCLHIVYDILWFSCPLLLHTAVPTNHIKSNLPNNYSSISFHASSTNALRAWLTLKYITALNLFISTTSNNILWSSIWIPIPEWTCTLPCSHKLHSIAVVQSFTNMIGQNQQCICLTTTIMWKVFL